jgi:hypothetical protein
MCNGVAVLVFTRDLEEQVEAVYAETPLEVRATARNSDTHLAHYP